MRTEEELRQELKYFLFSHMEDRYVKLELHIIEKAQNQDISYYLMWDDKYDFNKHPVEQINIDVIKKWWQEIAVRLFGEKMAKFLLDDLNNMERKFENKIQQMCMRK